MVATRAVARSFCLSRLCQIVTTPAEPACKQTNSSGAPCARPDALRRSDALPRPSSLGLVCRGDFEGCGGISDVIGCESSTGCGDLMGIGAAFGASEPEFVRLRPNFGQCRPACLIEDISAHFTPKLADRIWPVLAENLADVCCPSGDFQATASSDSGPMLLASKFQKAARDRSPGSIRGRLVVYPGSIRRRPEVHSGSIRVRKRLSALRPPSGRSGRPGDAVRDAPATLHFGIIDPIVSL